MRFYYNFSSYRTPWLWKLSTFAKLLQRNAGDDIEEAFMQGCITTEGGLNQFHENYIRSNSQVIPFTILNSIRMTSDQTVKSFRFQFYNMISSDVFASKRLRFLITFRSSLERCGITEPISCGISHHHEDKKIPSWLSCRGHALGSQIRSQRRPSKATM